MPSALRGHVLKPKAMLTPSREHGTQGKSAPAPLARLFVQGSVAAALGRRRARLLGASYKQRERGPRTAAKRDMIRVTASSWPRPLPPRVP
jgi:hypothetical protein